MTITEVSNLVSEIGGAAPVVSSAVSAVVGAIKSLVHRRAVVVTEDNGTPITPADVVARIDTLIAESQAIGNAAATALNADHPDGQD